MLNKELLSYQQRVLASVVRKRSLVEGAQAVPTFNLPTLPPLAHFPAQLLTPPALSLPSFNSMPDRAPAPSPAHIGTHLSWLPTAGMVSSFGSVYSFARCIACRPDTEGWYKR